MTTDQARLQLYLRLADDHLVLGHRLSEWIGHAPMLEEELALANTGLDLLGQARALYAAAGPLDERGRSEDEFAFLRADREYLNLLLVERPNGDFAHTMLRLLYFTVFMREYWAAAAMCADTGLAEIAAKAVKESSYHARHSAEWVIRLGDGTEESAARTAEAVVALAPYCDEMFDQDEVTQTLDGLAPDPATLRDAWQREIDAVFLEAALDAAPKDWPQRGGRSGRHGEAFGFLLSDLQYMQRSYPGLTW